MDEPILVGTVYRRCSCKNRHKQWMIAICRTEKQLYDAIGMYTHNRNQDPPNRPTGRRGRRRGGCQSCRRRHSSTTAGVRAAGGCKPIAASGIQPKLALLTQSTRRLANIWTGRCCPLLHGNRNHKDTKSDGQQIPTTPSVHLCLHGFPWVGWTPPGASPGL